MRPPVTFCNRVWYDISIHAPQWGATATPLGTSPNSLFQSTHPSGVRRRRLPPRGCPRGYFNPRTPVGCDATSPPSGCRRSNFNPRTPVGCDKPMVDQITEMYEFQSTHPSGVRPGGQGSNAQATSISIHAPQWGATRLVFPPVRRDGFQSTHPSGVRLGLPAIGKSTFVISIHAPQWGATLIPRVRRAENGISIHAPQWGATVLGTSRFPWVSYFNPRTPVGCDTIPRGDAGTAGVFQSTHPSGVRLSVQTATSVDFLFQSTHPSGVRLSAFLLAASLSRFQSTHPSGVRHGRFFLF